MKKLKPENFFLIASLIFGLLYAIFVPYGAGFDEERHLARIYYMSLGEMMPNFPQPVIQNEVFELSYQRRYIQSPAFDMYSSESLTRKFSRLEEDLHYGYRTQSIYSPVIFLPQALIGRALWWKFNFPILPTIMLQRIAGLLIYFLGTYFAIRVVPFGKWVFAILALTPAALYQAATLNADGFTNAASFLFIAWVLAIYKNEGEGVQKRSVWILLFLMIWLGVAKPGAIILFPLLFILVKRPFPSKKWVLLLLVGILLGVLLNVGWWSVAMQGSTFSGSGQQSISGELGSLVSFEFLRMLVQSLVLTFSLQIKGWIAAFGFGAGKVPELVYWFWYPVVFLALALERENVVLTRWTRVFLVGMSLLSFLGIYTVVFIPSHIYGGLTALAKHGRYIIPFAPLLFLGLTGIFLLEEKWRLLASRTMVLFFLLSQGFHSVGIYTAYYTYCNYDAYVGGKCVLPIYKNIEKEGVEHILLVEGVEISQTFTKFCGDLEAVEIYINQKPVSLQGKLDLFLIDEYQNILFSDHIQAQEIRDKAYLEFLIETPSNAGHDVYEIQLTSSDMSAEGLGVALTPTDFYPGQLSINGQARSQDLLIHYVCSTP